MKRILIASIVCLLVASCDPKDMPTEDITLPDIEFAFRVDPDTSYIKIGNTLILESLASTHLGGVELIDGEALIDAYLWHYPYNPITHGGGGYALEGDHYTVTKEHGDFNYNTGVAGLLRDFKTWPQGDNFKIKYSFVFLKKGVYVFSLASKFYEGKKGKSRTAPYFDVLDHHWTFYEIPNQPNPQPGDNIYDKKYIFCVTD